MTAHASGRLVLRRGRVAALRRPGPAAELVVEVAGEARPALSYERMTGPVEVGDEVVVNIAAADLGLGSGGFDVVHVNLTRGLEADGEPDARVMKLNYTSLQHAVRPLEERSPELERPVARPVAAIALHGQLAPVVWAAAAAAPGARIGYVQTGGGALPGALSQVVRELRERGLLAGHVTAGSAFGGEEEAVSVVGGLHSAFGALGWDAAVAGPGPGILGSATALGHGGLAVVDTAHAALGLGCRTILVPRLSEGDPRPRHRGLSHHTRVALELLLRPVTVAAPEEGGSAEGPAAGFEGPAAAAASAAVDALRAAPGGHELRFAGADLDGYHGSGLPARTMGRTIAQDELFFRGALAGGGVLGEEIDGV